MARRHALGEQLGAHDGGQVLLHEVARGHVDVERHLQAARTPRRQLREPAGEHPARDGLDAAGLLRERNELVGRHEAARRMAPADQHLGRQAAAVDQRDLGLVLQVELVLVDCAAQVGQQAQAVLAGARHLRVEGGEAAAGLLGDVHRRVGVRHQLGRVAAVVGEGGDADRAADVHRLALDRHRRVERAEQLARQHRGAFAALRRQQHGELVAADAGHGVGGAAQLARQAAGHLVEQLVADRMAQHVVDFLETIQVDQQHRHRVAGARRGAHGLVQAVVEQRAIGQARQRIAEREVDDARLSLRQAVAHLAERDDQPPHFVAACRGHRAVQLAVGDLARERHRQRERARDRTGDHHRAHQRDHHREAGQLEHVLAAPRLLHADAGDRGVGLRRLDGHQRIQRIQHVVECRQRLLEHDRTRRVEIELHLFDGVLERRLETAAGGDQAFDDDGVLDGMRIGQQLRERGLLLGEFGVDQRVDGHPIGAGIEQEQRVQVLRAGLRRLFGLARQQHLAQAGLGHDAARFPDQLGLLQRQRHDPGQQRQQQAEREREPHRDRGAAGESAGRGRQIVEGHGGPE